MIGLLVRVLPVTMAGYAVSGGSSQMKGMADEALNAVLQLKTSMELRGIVQSIRLDLIHGDPFPDDLEAYIDATMDSQGTDPTLDAWGSPYELDEEGGARFVISLGPDKSYGTDDDIRAIVHDEHGRYRRRRSNRR